MNKQNKPVKVRTARDPSESDPQYVIKDGAPKCYVSGYGMVGPGAVVSYPEGEKPSKWAVRVHPSDAAKAVAEPEKAEELARKAAEKQPAK